MRGLPASRITGPSLDTERNLICPNQDRNMRISPRKIVAYEDAVNVASLASHGLTLPPGSFGRVGSQARRGRIGSLRYDTKHQMKTLPAAAASARAQ